MKSVLVFASLFLVSSLAFAQGAPADPSAPSALAQSGPAWQAAVLVFGLTILPLLDKLITAGEWPFGWAVAVRYRFVLLALVGGALTCLQAVQGGTSWGAAALTAALAVLGAILRNGASLFGGLAPQMKDAPPVSLTGPIAKLASKAPPPVAMLFLVGVLGLGAIGATVHTPGRRVPIDSTNVPSGSVAVSAGITDRAYWLTPSKTVSLGGGTGCAAWKQDAKTVLDVVQTACILAAPIEAPVADLALACGIAEADIPLLEKIIAGRKAGFALKVAGSK